ncbi:uncharacterized protein JN550_005650 [Neoarthrinium moseri]|uniref:uncharacterized protein n=1 Tax=Neoarthrinium moseri TaxID=1658444 RepID=UPI001FDBEEF4|nr:uncharacterized protein JN550_005650 [Neoarthrinium moseri]KAI1869669.1 hypothetical protein JN550_005650 [Neoarthrinium moseri]
MTSQTRKRKFGTFQCANSEASSSIEVVRATKKDHKIVPRAAEKGKTGHNGDETQIIVKQELDSITDMKPSRTLQANNPNKVCSVNESIEDIKSIALSSEQLVAQLREETIDWKDGVAEQSQKVVQSYETRMKSTEDSVNAVVDGSKALGKKYEQLAGEINKRTDARLKEFTDHMAAFFAQKVTAAPYANNHFGVGDFACSTPSVANSTGSFKSSSEATKSSMSSYTSIPPTSKLSDKVTPTAASVGSKTTTSSVLKLGISSNGYFTDTRLTKAGYQHLLHTFDFTDVAKLEHLSKIDNRSHSRDYFLFCDLTSPNANTDYVIRIGESAASIMDHAPGVIYKNHPDLMNHNLTSLRIFELEISDDKASRNELAQLDEWKRKYQPPRYVYDLGQLFLFRHWKKGSTRTTLISSCYNVVMDVTKAEKSLWLVARPGCPLDVRQNSKNHKDHTIAFNQSSRSYIACLSKNVRNICFTREKNSQDSFPEFTRADNLVLESACNVPVEIRAKAANIKKMQELMESA